MLYANSTRITLNNIRFSGEIEKSTMQIGKLDRRVSIYYKNEQSDMFGQEPEGKGDLLSTVWAEAIDFSGNRNYANSKIKEDSDIGFTIRYLSTVKQGQIIVFEENEYIIQHVGLIGRNNGMRLEAKMRQQQ